MGRKASSFCAGRKGSVLPTAIEDALESGGHGAAKRAVHQGKKASSDPHYSGFGQALRYEPQDGLLPSYGEAESLAKTPQHQGRKVSSFAVSGHCGWSPDRLQTGAGSSSSKWITAYRSKRAEGASQRAAERGGDGRGTTAPTRSSATARRLPRLPPPQLHLPHTPALWTRAHNLDCELTARIALPGFRREVAAVFQPLPY
jgi:hypothetical protein